MSRKKRRSYSAEFKFQIVLEILRGEKSAAQICRDHNLRENLLSRWKQAFLERGASIFEAVFTSVYNAHPTGADIKGLAEMDANSIRLALHHRFFDNVMITSVSTPTSRSSVWQAIFPARIIRTASIRRW